VTPPSQAFALNSCQNHRIFLSRVESKFLSNQQYRVSRPRATLEERQNYPSQRPTPQALIQDTSTSHEHLYRSIERARVMQSVLPSSPSPQPCAVRKLQEVDAWRRGATRRSDEWSSPRVNSHSSDASRVDMLSSIHTLKNVNVEPINNL